MPDHALRAILAEPWAIDPAYLHVLAALAQRQPVAGDWSKRDYPLIAGPNATKLEGGSSRAYVVDGVAVISVMGPIFPRANLMTEMCGATSCATLQADTRAAEREDNVGGVLYVFDTPGGAVSGVNAAADMLHATRQQAKKPMSAFVAGTAASAGYWLASQLGEITVERTSIVGSIGVVTAMAKQVQPDADGYVDIEIVSSNAPNKRPDPTTEDGFAAVRATLDAIEREFIADVARGRGVSAKTVAEQFGMGGVKVGADALAAGMADRIGSYESALARMQQMVRAKQRAAAVKK